MKIIVELTKLLFNISPFVLIAYVIFLEIFEKGIFAAVSTFGLIAVLWLVIAIFRRIPLKDDVITDPKYASYEGNIYHQKETSNTSE